MKRLFWYSQIRIDGYQLQQNDIEGQLCKIIVVSFRLFVMTLQLKPKNLFLKRQAMDGTRSKLFFFFFLKKICFQIKWSSALLCSLSYDDSITMPNLPSLPKSLSLELCVCLSVCVCVCVCVFARACVCACWYVRERVREKERERERGRDRESVE